jgi:antitoxin (DNA-binding transcriptional repressor) of toxin-antitoxin stability system
MERDGPSDPILKIDGEHVMQTMPLEQVEGRLAEVIERLSPGEELVLTRNDKPVAKLIGAAGEAPRPLPGRGKGLLTIISEDDEHLKDFAEYMPYGLLE